MAAIVVPCSVFLITEKFTAGENRRARKAFNQKLSTLLVREYGGIATAKSEVRKITRRPKPIVNKEGTGYDPNGAFIKSQFNKLVLASGLSQFTTLIEQKAAVHGREFIEIAPKSIPDELLSRFYTLPRESERPRYWGIIIERIRV